MTSSTLIFPVALGLSLLATPMAVQAQAIAPPTLVAPAARSGVAGLTLQQFQSRHEAKMLAADTDGDGRVSKAEFLAAAKTGKGDPATRFAKLDRNGDGYLDRAEIAASLARRFHRLDTNGDGILSAQERAAAKNKGAKADPGA